MTIKKSVRWLVVIPVGIGAFIVLIALVLMFATRRQRSVAAAAETVTVAPTVPPEPPKEPTLAERLASAATLAEALALIQPRMGDSENELHPASVLLAVWAASHEEAFDYSELEKTTWGRIMKDPDEERGRKYCTSGRVTEINADKSVGIKFYTGGLMTPGGNIVRFIAVGPTGDLVEGSSASLCGIVTGKYSYSNTGGGTTHSIMVVGDFYIPTAKR